MKPLLLIACAGFFAGLTCCRAEMTNAPAADSLAYGASEFRPGTLWLDDKGVHINAHGGGVLLHEGIYYWFGEHKVAGAPGNSAQVGVHVYSSRDLYSWKDAGIALAVASDPASEITKGCVLERPKVIFNAKTGKFVMWFHLELKGKGYRAAKSGVAIADRVTGPYRYLYSLRPNAGAWPENFPQAERKVLSPEEKIALSQHHFTGGPSANMPPIDLVCRRDFEGGQMSRDMTLFVDDDQKAYQIYSAEENGTIQISQLTEDYLKPAGHYIRILPGQFNEAPALFKHAGKYFLITSGTSGWAPNAARLATADSILGTWTVLGNPCRGTEREIKRTFDSQSTFVLPVSGKKDAYIFMADRWRPKDAIDGRYVWLPVQWDKGIPFLQWQEKWNLNRIHYDSHCLTIDGKDVFIYSGAFHYFRCPKELWRDRFQKITDAGFNCVETYVAWNWCEQEMPADAADFSKINLTDLDDFLKMAEEFGLYVIVRPGPYICAEWDTGGYPQWLLAKKPNAPRRNQGWLRSDDPVYLAWCRHWYDAVCPVIAKHQITRKAPGAPGVILVQVENEYDFGPHFSEDVKINQVKALAGDARAGGIDVPLITCWTHQVRGSTDPVLRQIFDCSNFYPRWNVEGELRPKISQLRAEQPDAPLATTELQGGWFSKVGGKLSEEQDGITASQINNLTLFALQMGDTIVNYYMLFGGTNPGDWAARELTTTYDYAAPIREWGGVDDRYQRVWALGHMLQEHGAKIARAEPVECEVTGTQKDVTVVERRAQDGSRYFFVRTSQHAEPRAGTAHVKEKTSGEAAEIVFDYKLEPFGSTILYLPSSVNDVVRGEWLPKAAPAIQRPTDLPPGVTITSARSHNDSGPSQWTRLKSGENLAQAGIYDSRFIFYRRKLSSANPTNLLVEYPGGDTVLATVNGRRAVCVGNTRGSSIFALPAGSSAVQLLYENLGHANGGSALEQPCGISAVHFTSGTLRAAKPITGWRMHEVDGTSNRPEIKTDFQDDDWMPVAVRELEANNLPVNRTAVFRAWIEVTAADLSDAKTVLNFGRIDDLGWVFVNGKSVGNTTDPSRACAIDITKQLHPGRNLVAVIIRNTAGNGGLGAPSMARESGGDAVPPEVFGSPAGIEQQWWKPEFKDKSWKTVAIGEDSVAAKNDSVLTWYRMNFQMPGEKSGLWVPWHVRLNANGNGFIYLNGHALGRYWEAGPQHDFFLPECWLNFGKANNLTLSLRPTDNGAAIKSAVVEPYAEFGERR